MDEAMERFHRLIRAPPSDEFVITPPAPLLDEIERLGQDPRRPRTAIARWAARTWREAVGESFRRSPATELAASHAEKEVMERPQHYPTDWGLDLIPHPDDLGGAWTMDRLYTGCYTSLSAPRPFDPHLHGTMPNPALGFGYHYLSDSGFPDAYDIVARRGGGPRGGFAFTTGPTEGAYPSAILPQPTFNLGELGFSNGGWNPEGLQWTNRPKRMKLAGLRNGWPHRVMFARSRRVLHRNIYGPLSVDEATPRAPSVIVNGIHPMSGVLSISMSRSLNAPTAVDIDLNNVAGRRSGVVKDGDVVQVYAAPRSWATPPLVFTGFVSSITESANRLRITALDTLGYLSRDVIQTTPSYEQQDAATVIKNLVAGSVYSPPIGRMTNLTYVTLPTNLNLSNRSRLDAIQTVLQVINATPATVLIEADAHGVINLRRLREVDDAGLYPLDGGTLPRTGDPQDFYPAEVDREDGDEFGFNVVHVLNEDLDISVIVPPTTSDRYPARPVTRIVRESAIADETQARLVGEQLLAQQGSQGARWTVVGRPERFDIRPGDVIEFATSAAGLSGRQRVFNVRWRLTPSDVEMVLTVGRQQADVLSSIRLAANVSL